MDRRYLILIAALAATFACAVALAQGFGRGFRIVQNDPPPTELVVARWAASC
jgi:hypothetical protein